MNPPARSRRVADKPTLVTIWLHELQDALGVIAYRVARITAQLDEDHRPPASEHLGRALQSKQLSTFDVNLHDIYSRQPSSLHIIVKPDPTARDGINGHRGGRN